VVGVSFRHTSRLLISRCHARGRGLRGWWLEVIAGWGDRNLQALGLNMARLQPTDICIALRYASVGHRPDFQIQSGVHPVLRNELTVRAISV